MVNNYFYCIFVVSHYSAELYAKNIFHTFMLFAVSIRLFFSI